jgi:phosphatidylinositol glycan class T
MGSGNERGAVAILLKSTVPWVLKVLVIDMNCMLIFSKLSLGILGYVIILSSCLWMTKPKAAGAFVEKMHVFPSKDKISPGMMEMVLKLPCGVKSAALILEFALR